LRENETGVSVAHRNREQGFDILTEPFFQARLKQLPKLSPLWRNRPILKWLKHDTRDARAEKQAR
jgi:hypothetical protein